MNAPLPADELQRLQAVQRYNILDTPPEAAFERLTRMAARVFNVPIAIVNLVDADRQWFKSCFGLDVRETAREVALCAHAILTDSVLVVPDARLDARFADNPLVTNAPGVRFYAGAPLRAPDGVNIGTLAIMDVVPRTLDDAEIATLSDLAALAVDEMELRLAATKLQDEVSQTRQGTTLNVQHSEDHFRSLIENASDIIAVVDGEGTMRYQSPSLERVLGYGPGELIGRNAFELIHPEDAGVVQEALQRVFQNPGVGQTAEYRFRHQDGSWRVLESVGKTVPDDSAMSGVVINSRDVTERKQIEASLQQARDQLQVVLDTIPGGVSWIDSDLKYHGTNRYLAEAFHLPAEEFIGKSVGFMGVSLDYPGLVRDFMASPEQQTSFEFAVNVDGEVRTVLMTARKYEADRAVFVGTDISERKQAEDALQLAHDELEVRVQQRTRELATTVETLRESEARFRLVTEAIPQQVWTTQPDGTVDYVNQQVLKYFECTSEEMIDRGWEDSVHPEDLPQVLARGSHSLQTGEPYEAEFRLKRAGDNTYRWILGRSLPLRDAEDRIVKWFGTNTDITEHKQAEEALREQKEMLQTIFDHIPVMISFYDSNGTFYLANRALEHILGWSLEEMRNHPDFMTELYPDPEERRVVVDAMQQATGEWIECRMRVRDGRTINTYWAHIRLADGMRIGIGQDITARRQVEQALHESEGRSRLLVEGAKDYAMLLMDTDRDVVHWNAGAERIIGYSKSEALGHSADIIFTPEDRANGVPEHETRQAAEHGRADDKRWHLRKDGTRFWADGVMTALYNDNGQLHGFAKVMRDATREKQTEQELLESEARLRLVTEAIPQQVWTARPDGALDYVNQRVLEHFGHTFDEMIDWGWTEVIHPDDLPGTLASWRHSLETGELYEVEFRLKRASDGMYRWNLVRALPMRDGEGRIVKWFGTNTDIDERKQAEEQNRFQAHLLNTIAQAVIATDLKGTVSYWNRYAEELYGWPASEAVGRNIVDLTVPQATKQQAVEIMDRLMAGGRWIGEFIVQRHDGTTFPALVTNQPIRDTAGTLTGIIGVSTDITERRQAEEELRRSEARKAAILETALDCIITIDHEGKVLDWNPAAETTFGYSRHEAVGRLMGELIVPESLREQHVHGVAHYLATRESVVLGKRLELPAVCADGREILVEVSTNAIHTVGDGPPLFTSHLRDITEHKQAEVTLKEAKEEAERANRAKSEFLSRMSHELRTPMNAILGFGQLLEMDDLDAEHREGVEQILKAGRHLLELINEVLDIARIESEEQPLEIEPVRVVEALTGALDMVRPLATPHNITLRDDWSAAENLSVLADRRGLNQVVLNLLSNAVKYNRAGGTTTLSSAPVGAGRVSIAISDTGIGIAPENMDRLWTPFDRLGAERTDIEGSGLGLALTQRLVEAMGGTIAVQSTLGVGSTFIVELPLTSARPMPDEPTQVTAAATPIQFAGESESQTVVLYIEDNLSNFGLVQNTLRRRPEIKLMAAMQGRLGVALAVEHRPDLILLDVHLPDIDGHEVLRLLRAEPDTRQIPVVVVSADATPYQIERLMDAGACDYLTKPLDLKRFLEVVDTRLQEQQKGSSG